MKAKDYLLQLRKLDKMIENKLAERERWNAIATSVTQQLSADRVVTSGNPQKMENAILNLIEAENEVDEAIASCVATRREIIATIDKLCNANQTYYEVIHEIYVQNLTLSDVAEKRGQSRSWADQNHGRALNIVQRIIDERERNASCS